MGKSIEGIAMGYGPITHFTDVEACLDKYDAAKREHIYFLIPLLSFLSFCFTRSVPVQYQELRQLTSL